MGRLGYVDINVRTTIHEKYKPTYLDYNPAVTKLITCKTLQVGSGGLGFMV